MRLLRISLVRISLAFGLACTPRAMPVSANHPANPDAEVGRLAGPPVALQPGGTAIPIGKPAEPAATRPAHEGHH